MMGSPVWANAVALLAAVILAGVGGEMFVRGVVGTAERWRLSELLVAMTVAACATSAPEMTVAIMASMDGNSALAMGDALGSNVTNILLILGVSLMFGRLAASVAALRWHLVCVAAAPLAALGLLADGVLSRRDGGILLLGFAAWLVVTLISVRGARAPQSDQPPAASNRRPAALAALLVAGITILAVAGHLFAQAGRALAELFDFPDAVVGATVIALGTSMPELMTTVVSRWRGHHDVGLGTLLGSNLFNGLAILGTAALIAPVQPPLLPVWVMLASGVLAVVLVVPWRGGLGRLRGAGMLTCYALYVAAMGAVLGLGKGS